MAKVDPGKGYRLLEWGAVAIDGDEVWSHGRGPWKRPCLMPGVIRDYHAPFRRKVTESTESTKKPKEQKIMTAKKPKPTAKASKYPAPREAITYGVTVTGKSTKESIKGLLDLTIEIHNGTLKDLATTGTKLDRALVDLKDAKKRIKELERKMSGEIA